MGKSIFNLAFQQKSVASKIVIGLERISETFRALLWEHAKVIGLSPIQIQLVIFIAYHNEELCNVSQLAREFSVTKPTISDAIKALENKGLIKKELSTYDNRRYSISLSDEGSKIVTDIEKFANPIKTQVEKIAPFQLDNLYFSLTQLIHNLNKVGVIKVQRICYGCRFYDKNKHEHYCNYLNKSLLTNEIRLDCPEYEKAKK